MLNLKKFGQIHGVDISPKAIAYCQKNGLKKVFLRKNKTLPFPNNNFYLITGLDVLEHLENDRKELREIQRILLPGGKLILFVPAFPFLWGRLDEKSHHFRRYTKKNLEEKLSAAGFKIKKISYFNYLFFLPILLVRTWQKTFLGRNNTWGDEPIIQSLTVNRILTAIFTLDVKTSSWFSPPFGVSLLAIAEKLSQPAIRPKLKN